MHKIVVFILLLTCLTVTAQNVAPVLKPEKQTTYTSIKNQGASGTCWCFSGTSLIESVSLKKGATNVDISEMYTVRNIYIEKAKNYILREGTAQFGEGGLGHDAIRSIANYGAVPESAYTGLKEGVKVFNHSKMVGSLKAYLDSTLKKRPIAANWLEGYTNILDSTLGKPPVEFTFNGKTYTPQSYASDVLKFDSDDYVSITSFTDHPFYTSYVLSVPDNFANGSFYNLPLEEMIGAVKTSIDKGYSVLWDADVSNNNFAQGKGFAMLWKADKAPKEVNPDEEEKAYDATTRQQLFENLTTQDDHLMHLVGMNTSEKGKAFFTVKNSWGEVGPYKGLINVSVPYFAINTISLVVPKAALDKEVKKKLGLK